MEKIKVLYITDHFVYMGGAEKNLLQVALNHDRERFTPIVCCLQGGELVDRLRQAGVRVDVLNIRRIYGFKAALEAVKLFRLIKKEKIRVAVTYHESSDFWGGIIAKLAGVPVILSSRRDMGFSLKQRHVFFYRFLNRIFERIIVVSDAVGKAVSDYQKVDPDRIITVYNGIDQAASAPRAGRDDILRSLGLPGGEYPVIGILAGLRSIKGHEYFVAAAVSALKSIPDARFLIVGGWQDEGPYLKVLKEMVANAGAEDRIIFTGPRSDIAEIQSVLDISVISSLSEGFSNTILESMAAGKPVVATAVGGNPEAVSDGDTGILVPPADARPLAAAIIRLLKDRAAAARMGEAGRRKVNDYFTQAGMMSQLETTYEVLLAAKKESARQRFRRKAIKLIKIAVSTALYYAGALRLFERLTGRGCLKILAYHRVSDGSSLLNLNIPRAVFEEQMKYLGRKYGVVGLDKVVDAITSGKGAAYGSVVITFDDGYRSLLDNAVPALKRYGLPATVYLTVNPIQKLEPMWFDTLSYAMKNTKKKTIDLGKFGAGKYLLNTPEEKRVAAEAAANHAKTLDSRGVDEFVNWVADELKVDQRQRDAGNMDALTWGDVKKMAGDGIMIGAHTMSHHILTKLPPAEAEREIAECRDTIIRNAGVAVEHFAYPNGELSDFNAEIVGIIKKHGYKSACTLVNGIDNTDVFALRRMNIYPYMSTGMTGKFNKPLFAAELSGVFDFLRRIK